ncbi:MAG: phosphoribosylglycinamide formyltransferase [Sphingomonas sp.]|nr:phosphoribosylglycinamide formyltransferase [Sphingomonas sp.]
MAKRRLAILLSGRGSNMQALVAAAQAPSAAFEIALIASDKPDAPGIGWATEQGLPTFTHAGATTAKAEHEAAIDTALQAAGAEFVALAGYMRILSGDFVARWAGRILNIHPSLLPKYKGLNTHARAIDAGDKVAGCSVHIVTEALDAGEVLGRAVVPILPGDTAEALAARVLVAEHRLYPRLVSEYVTR